MKTLMCKDVSGLECPFVARGSTDEEVKAKLMDHVMEAHPQEMTTMSDDQELEMDLRINSLLSSQL